jgi:hypothetical protein
MTDVKEHQPRKRGDAAWKEQREAIATRNAQAKKLGREQRQASERADVARRRADEKRRSAAVRDAHDRA